MAASKTRRNGRKSAKTKPGEGANRRRAKRGTGEKRIVAAAAKFFAEHGFRAPTRGLARRLGVTQALLYRYFPSKRSLIERTFETVFIADWDPRLTQRLLDPSAPLRDRLVEFYIDFTRRSTPIRTRLFIRAGLDHQGLANRYVFPLNNRILTPVISALRQAAGLPSPEAKPILRAERELAMTLHGAISHLHIRKNVHKAPLPDDLGTHVAFYVECFLDGALTTIARLHEQPPPRFLGQRLGNRRGEPIE